MGRCHPRLATSEIIQVIWSETIWIGGQVRAAGSIDDANVGCLEPYSHSVCSLVIPDVRDDTGFVVRHAGSRNSLGITKFGDPRCET